MSEDVYQSGEIFFTRSKALSRKYRVADTGLVVLEETAPLPPRYNGERIMDLSDEYLENAIGVLQDHVKSLRKELSAALDKANILKDGIEWRVEKITELRAEMRQRSKK